MRRVIALSVLLCIVMTSALEIVLYRHESRKLFSTLQALQAERKELDREWGQLLLEEGTWGTHGRIEQIARDKLNMTLPLSKDTYRVRS